MLFIPSRLLCRTVGADPHNCHVSQFGQQVPEADCLLSASTCTCLGIEEERYALLFMVCKTPLIAFLI